MKDVKVNIEPCEIDDILEVLSASKYNACVELAQALEKLIGDGPETRVVIPHLDKEKEIPPWPFPFA